MLQLTNYTPKLLQAALIICLIIGNRSTEAIQSSTALSSRSLQTLGECFIEYEGCEQSLEVNEETIEIICDYTIVPGDSQYNTIWYPVDENGECQIGVPIDPPPYVSITSDSGTGEDGEFSVNIEIDRELLAAELALDPELTYKLSFCVENNIITTDVDGIEQEIGTHLTKIDVGVELEGEFVTMISLNSFTASDEFSVTETYTVSSYLCSEDEPHEEITGDFVYELNSKVVICVITNEGDTILQKITEFRLTQYKEDGLEINHSFLHITDDPDRPPALSLYDCTQVKPGSDVPGSMCVIQAKLVKNFFVEPELGLTGVGISDLRLNPDVLRRKRELQGKGTRDLEIKKPTIISDGHYNLQLSLNNDDASLKIASFSILKNACFTVLLLSATAVFFA
uniref:Uncharacterized protein n=1 Tax=Proboscia inermis TaxID=420281 RepID=A0A7S0GC43_9STRA|mmetsp:Transcript_23158/g.23548  ORF Transcript_23158/g.23548 Transcript_23158/m.23548 type:complete len:397 (+) Transcript_23158:46-1236(+)